jgi:hypothetical protein
LGLVGANGKRHNGTKKSAAWRRYKSAAVLTAHGYKNLLPWPQRQNEKK